MQITDVSPTAANTDASADEHCVSGRMLSVACTPDGQSVYLGSYSNVWASADAGKTFDQLSWPQPPSDQYVAPGALGGWCTVDLAATAGWTADHPRALGRLTEKPSLDLVGFGDCGVWTAIGDGAGSFAPPRVVLANFGPQAGGWHVDRHPRFVADLTGDGTGDLVGFGDAGVWTALGNGDGTFAEARFVLANFGPDAGGWQVDRHPRFVVDLTADGRADLLGFGDAGVWTALGNGDGTFAEARFVLANFGTEQGWRVDRHPRFLADLTGDGRPDLVGFGDAGVWTALGNGDGTFAEARFVLANLGTDQGWRVERHPRFVVDLTGDGRCDLLGCGDAGVWSALGNGDGTFAEARFVLANFGPDAGGWQVDRHPRFAVDLTGDGAADLVGFGDAGVWTARGRGDGGFDDARFVLANLGTDQGWRVERHPRLLGRLTGGGACDVVGFGDAGVWTARGRGDGGFDDARFVLASMGWGATVLALQGQDRVVGSRGVWRSTDGGDSWTQVHRFPAGYVAGQLEWAVGSDHLVYAAGGSSLAISQDGGLTFADVFPWGNGSTQQVNHVAAWQHEPADAVPAVIYALGASTMALSFDGGTTWQVDRGVLPSRVGGTTSPVANGNSARVMAVSPRFPLEVYVAGDGSGVGTAALLHRGDYSSFPLGAQTSTWEDLPLPDELTDIRQGHNQQDSGNVFLAATRHDRGDLLFYGAQRRRAFVGPLVPGSTDDWKPLDGTVHRDLHGLLLSPDFSASLVGGDYDVRSGTVWLLTDGGGYHSDDGGRHLHRSDGTRTLSVVNLAGVARPGAGPALSLNTGDNDGFFSTDGGAHWSYQQYGGGDNDCSYADPSRPHEMLVATPRWDLEGDGVPAREGTTVSVYTAAAGSLANAASSGHSARHVTGPPLLPAGTPGRPVWNGSSQFFSRGSRPVVLGLPGEAAPEQGDYVFVLDPTQPQAVVARTQRIRDIDDRDEWRSAATGPDQGAHVFRQGPPLPRSNLGVLQASGGHASPTFYAGGDGTLWTWTAGQSTWRQLVPGTGPATATRFFVDPYRPARIYVLDGSSIQRSEDGGLTWAGDQELQREATWNGQLRIKTNADSSGVGDQMDVVLTDMAFDPDDPGVRFAAGEGGVFATFDGAIWSRLLHTGALCGRPANLYYDHVSEPTMPAVYVGFAGRSVVRISELRPVVLL